MKMTTGTRDSHGSWKWEKRKKKKLLWVFSFAFIPLKISSQHTLPGCLFNVSLIYDNCTLRGGVESGRKKRRARVILQCKQISGYYIFNKNISESKSLSICLSGDDLCIPKPRVASITSKRYSSTAKSFRKWTASPQGQRAAVGHAGAGSAISLDEALYEDGASLCRLSLHLRRLWPKMIRDNHSLIAYLKQS